MSKAKSKATGPRVYSYIRFSTPDQLKGNSLERQRKMSQDWCDRNGCVLDTSFKLDDLGVSAFRSKNATHGKLAGFLKAVEAGEIEAGSILLVESLDRLSRDQIRPALTQFLSILDKGVSIVTLNPEETFSSESTKDDLVQIIVALVIMSRAYEESATKSMRIGDSRDRARKAAREQLKMLTSVGPKWLRPVIDPTDKTTPFELIPEAAETIQLIFKWKNDGLGTGTIEKKLNANAPWTPERSPKRKNSGWAASYIKKILQNKAVIGEYQPYKKVNGKRIPDGDPIPGYYPRAVKPDLFYAVQQRMAGNKGKGGRTGKICNLFSHLVKCAYCQGSMTFVDKGKPPKGSQYLVCYAGKRGAGCKCRSIRYDECEEIILTNCHKLRPEQVLPNSEEQAKLSQRLRQRILAKVGELTQIEKGIKNLTDQIENIDHQASRDRYQKRVEELDARKVELLAQRAQDESELSRVEQGENSFVAWKKNLDTLRLAIRDNNPELRQRLQAHLRDFINSIEIFADGHPAGSTDRTYEIKTRRPNPKNPTQRKYKIFKPKDVGEEEFYERVMGGLSNEDYANARKDKKFQAFLRYVQDRLMKKEGRFLRIHFKSGATIDIVPEGSLASGFTLSRRETGEKDWKFVSPKTTELWRKFEESYETTPVVRRDNSGNRGNGTGTRNRENGRMRTSKVAGQRRKTAAE